MGQFMLMNTFDWVAVVKKEAREYDRIAKKRGTNAIAPMYCYPVPIKGTVSQIELIKMFSIAAISSRMYNNNFLTCICRKDHNYGLSCIQRLASVIPVSRKV
jgi:hypothetical protein